MSPLLSELSAREPAAQIVVGSAYAAMGSLAWLIHKALSRGRALRDSREQLLAGALRVPPKRSFAIEGAALALGLLVPVASVAFVSFGRRDFVHCLGSSQEGLPWHQCAPSDLGAEWPVQQLALLGVGALCWLFVLPLAAVAFGVARAHRLRARRLGEALAASRVEPDAEGRYRRSPGERERAAFDWLVMHPGPSALRCAAVAATFALLGFGVFAAGVVDTAWSLDISDFYARSYPRHLDAEVTRAYARLSGYAWAALGGMLVSALVAALAVSSARPPQAVVDTVARLRPRRPLVLRLLAVACPLAGACLCLLASLPLRAENAHPVAEAVRLEDMQLPAYLRGVQLPRSTGPDDVVDEPVLVIHRDLRATLDGQLLGTAPTAVVELEEMAKRKRELWRSFHPRRAFSGVMLLSADRRITTAQLEPFLKAVHRAGYPTLQLRCDRKHNFAHPPLGVWKSIHRSSAATVRLGEWNGGRPPAAALPLGGSADYAALVAKAVERRKTGADVRLTW